MGLIKEVDCEKCIKQKPKYNCDDCISYHADLPYLVGEKLEIALDEEFKRSFELAHNFASKSIMHSDFWGVYCGKDFLMASDTWTLVKIKADVPKSLVGKYLLEYNHENILAAKNKNPAFTNGQAQRIINEAQFGARMRSLLKRQMEDFVSVRYEEKGEKFVKINNGPVVQRALLDRAIAAIPDNEAFMLSYSPLEKHKPLLIRGKIIECIILPVKS